LDACRNNPFGGRGLRSSEGGLAQIRAPEGSLISYATQPGSVAQDGNDGHSPYTQDGNDGHSPYTRALADTIRRPGLDIFQTFNEVGSAVKRATGGSQQPWVTVTGAAQLVEFVEIVKEEIRVVAKESPKSGILANEDPAYLLSLGIPES
jgi:uncharacterized caspase-like protein